MIKKYKYSLKFNLQKALYLLIKLSTFKKYKDYLTYFNIIITILKKNAKIVNSFSYF